MVSTIPSYQVLEEDIEVIQQLENEKLGPAEIIRWVSNAIQLLNTLEKENWFKAGRGLSREMAENFGLTVENTLKEIREQVSRVYRDAYLPISFQKYYEAASIELNFSLERAQACLADVTTLPTDTSLAFDNELKKINNEYSKGFGLDYDHLGRILSHTPSLKSTDPTPTPEQRKAELIKILEESVNKINGKIAVLQIYHTSVAA